MIIPLYNSAPTLPRAVHSAARQTVQDIEVIIIDDASRDSSLAVAQRLAAEDKRINVIALPNNRGKSHAMNIAIAQARGDWVAVLDADDWYAEERLEALLAAGESTGVSLVADNQMFYDAAADRFVRTAFPESRGDRMLDKTAFIAGSDPYSAFNFGMLKPMVRTEYIRNTGLAYRENARLSEDFLYLVEFFASDATAMLLAQPLYNWTQSFGSESRQWTTTGAGSWRYDFQSALDANIEVLNLLRRRQQNDLANLLVSRARAYRQLDRLNEINRMRATGATLPQLLRVAAQHPSVWPLLARRALHVARHREQDEGVLS